MKKYLLTVVAPLCANVILAQQWGGSTDQTGNISRSGNIIVNGFYMGRYGASLAGDSNPFALYHADGNRDLTIYGSNGSTLHLRLYDGDLRLGVNATPTSTFYNAGNLSLGGTVGDRLVSTGEGKMNFRLGRWGTLGETGGAFATFIGSNIKSSTATDNRLEFITTTADGARAIQLHYLEGITFHTYSGSVTAGNQFSGYERMRIGNNGTVGIGTSTLDANFKLLVKGKIKAEEVQVVTAVADYVFEDDYKLMPLDQVEEYIKENKHLPGVPGKAEVDANGFQVGYMTNKVLEKVEELTLHLIELKKENEELKKKLEELEKKL